MKKTKPMEPVVYCGPAIPRITHSFTTYAEVPRALAALAVECPAISTLIVPLSRMADTRKALKIPSSREAILYSHIAKFIRGGIR